MAKFEFCSILLSYYKIHDENVQEDQTILFNLFKNVKELICFELPLTQQILSFKYLTKLRFFCDKMEKEHKLKSFENLEKQ